MPPIIQIEVWKAISIPKNKESILKITQILLKNFATVNEIQIDLNDDITYLVGENGSGKTTCGLNAIWFIMEGIAKAGKKVLHADRFRFIGKYGKSAVGQITLYDEKEDIEIYLQRKMTKNATTLKVAASDGRDLGPDFVDKIFNIFTINPEGFAKLSPKEQAVALGIDTATIEAKKLVAYDERRELGYAVKQLLGAVAECGEVEKTERVDIRGLLDKKNFANRDNEAALALAQEQREELYREAVAHNETQTKLRRDRDQQKANIWIVQHRLEDLNEEIKVASKKLVLFKDKLEKTKSPEPSLNTDIPMPEAKVIDTTVIEEEISEAQENNKKATAWEEFNKLTEKHADAVKAHEAKEAEYQGLEAERVAYLKSQDLPFNNVTINDKGELLVDGRPFCSPYSSKGEILRAGIKMAAAKDAELKYIFVPDAQSIDESSREALFTELTEKGFQVVAEMVGTKKRDSGNSILLKENQVVDSYDNTKSVL